MVAPTILGLYNYVLKIVRRELLKNRASNLMGDLSSLF